MYTANAYATYQNSEYQPIRSVDFPLNKHSHPYSRTDNGRHENTHDDGERHNRIEVRGRIVEVHQASPLRTYRGRDIVVRRTAHALYSYVGSSIWCRIEAGKTKQMLYTGDTALWECKTTDKKKQWNLRKKKLKLNEHKKSP